MVIIFAMFLFLPALISRSFMYLSLSHARKNEIFEQFSKVNYFKFTETSAMAITMKKAPMVENTVTGSFNTMMDRMTATTISDKSRTVEVDAERCLSPSSQR
jgi:hypothetical protein